MVTVYGITTCDTTRRAQKWLKDHHVNYQFHDYRVQGVTKELLQQVLTQHSWDKLLNKRSATFRELSSEVKETVNETNAIELMLASPTLIKRPLLETHTKNYLIGFHINRYQEQLLAHSTSNT